MSANFTDTLYYMLNLRDRERQTAIDQEQANNQALGNASAQAAAMGAAQEQANAARAQQQGQLGIAPGYNDPDLQAAAKMGAAAQQQALAAEQRKMQEQQLIEGMRQAGETGRVKTQVDAQGKWHADATAQQERNSVRDYMASLARTNAERQHWSTGGDPTRAARAMLAPIQQELTQIATTRRALEAQIARQYPWEQDKARAKFKPQVDAMAERERQLTDAKNRVLSSLDPGLAQLLDYGGPMPAPVGNAPQVSAGSSSSAPTWSPQQQDLLNQGMSLPGSDQAMQPGTSPMDLARRIQQQAAGGK